MKNLKQFIPVKLLRRIEHDRQKFTAHNERAVEYAFVFKWISRLRPKTILDVGSGRTALPALMRTCGSLVDAIDNKDFSNTHYHVSNHDITNPLDKKYDLITCVSTLEHIQESDLAVANMLQALNKRGHLIITCPYTEDKYISDVYLLEGSNAFDKDVSYICQSFSKQDLFIWTFKRGQIISQEFYRCWSGSFWTSGKQLRPTRSKTNHDLTCVLIKKI